MVDSRYQNDASPRKQKWSRNGSLLVSEVLHTVEFIQIQFGGAVAVVSSAALPFATCRSTLSTRTIGAITPPVAKIIIYHVIHFLPT
jgi:hypothetical protein